MGCMVGPKPRQHCRLSIAENLPSYSAKAYKKRKRSPCHYSGARSPREKSSFKADIRELNVESAELIMVAGSKVLHLRVSVEAGSLTLSGFQQGTGCCKGLKTGSLVLLNTSQWCWLPTLLQYTWVT